MKKKLMMMLRRFLNQKKVRSSRVKRKKTQSPAKQTTHKRGGKVKVPFSMARRLIPPMIFDEDELRHLALDFTEEEWEEVNLACDLINFQGWFELARGTT